MTPEPENSSVVPDPDDEVSDRYWPFVRCNVCSGLITKVLHRECVMAGYDSGRVVSLTVALADVILRSTEETPFIPE